MRLREEFSLRAWRVGGCLLYFSSTCISLQPSLPLPRRAARRIVKRMRCARSYITAFLFLSGSLLLFILVGRETNRVYVCMCILYLYIRCTYIGTMLASLPATNRRDGRGSLFLYKSRMHAGCSLFNYLVCARVDEQCFPRERGARSYYMRVCN